MTTAHRVADLIFSLLITFHHPVRIDLQNKTDGKMYNYEDYNKPMDCGARDNNMIYE